jgi:hypothetical protein
MDIGGFWDMRRIATFGFSAFVVLALTSLSVSAQDRHAGYYYPKPAEVEVYEARSRILAEADRRRRVGFVVAVVNDMLQRPYAPPLSVFVKGEQAQKLIIVANVSGRLDTVYRVRAYLATLTASARATPIFAEYEVEDWFTFLDLAKMMGFEQITVSDGDAFAHQIVLK